MPNELPAVTISARRQRPARGAASGCSVSQAAAAILRLRPGSAARGLHLRVWGRAAAQAAWSHGGRRGLKLPGWRGRRAVAAGVWPPPLGRRGAGQSLLRESMARAFAVRAGPPVVPGAAALQTRALPPLERETVLWAQQRPRGLSASGFFAGAGIPRSGEDCRGPRAQAAEAQAAAGSRAAHARESQSRPRVPVPPAPSREVAAAVEGGARPASGFFLLLPRSLASSGVAMATVVPTTRDPRASAACAVERLLWYQPGAAGTGFSGGAFPF